MTDQGVHVARLYIGALIEHSAFHTQQQAATAAGRPVLDIPVVDPAHLADLSTMQNTTHDQEVLHPHGLFAT